MFDLLLIPIAVIYLLIITALFIYGINFFYLAFLAWRESKRHSPPTLTTLPHVTVQLPLYNEMYVAERLINAVAAFDYPSDKLEIQVLDDSTDETKNLVANLVAHWRARGLDIVHLHRTARVGFKAGALAEGTKQAKGEFLALFDSDFIPQSDFLRQTIPSFADPTVAFVQTRWGHRNANYSLLTFLQALAIDGHFVVEQFARARGGYWFNFNGTAGVWRRAAMLDAGGWKADTLTEDLDLSYRAFLKGWRAVYLENVVTPAELPVTFSAYRRQQHRWAKGSFEVALKLLPQVWDQQIPLSKKLEATLHLTGYGIHLLMFALALLYPIVLFLSRTYSDLPTLFGIAFLFNLTALAPTTYFTLAQVKLRNPWRQRIPALIFLTALGAGMIMNTVHAAFQILVGQGQQFERTPKFGIGDKSDRWVGRQYQLSIDARTGLDVVFALWNLGTLLYSLELSQWAVTVYSGIFFLGNLFVIGITLAQNLELRSHQKARALAMTNEIRN